jgi:hypothetical protein
MSETQAEHHDHSQSATAQEPLDLPADSPVVLAHLIAEAINQLILSGHDCVYDIVGVTYRGPEPGRPRHPRLAAPEVTRVLLRCQICHDLVVRDLDGRWSPHEIFRDEPLTAGEGENEGKP